MDYDGTCDEYDDVFLFHKSVRSIRFWPTAGGLRQGCWTCNSSGTSSPGCSIDHFSRMSRFLLRARASALQTSLGFRARRLAAEPLTLSLPVPLPWGFSNALVEAAASGSVIYLPAEAAASVIDLPAEAADAPLVLAEAAGRLAPVEAR